MLLGQRVDRMGAGIVIFERIEFEGFRGGPQPFGERLATAGNFLYAENGRGKSTIADAMEFLVEGDFSALSSGGTALSVRRFTSTPRQRL